MSKGTKIDAALEDAMRDAEALARRTMVAYVYRLSTGRYYVSAYPPQMHSAEFVSVAYGKWPQR